MINCRCVKTGCDLFHEDMSWHGDLHYGDGVGFIFIASGRNSYGTTPEYMKYHFICDDVAMVGDEQLFIPIKVSKVSEDMLEFFTRYSEDSVRQKLENLGRGD